MNSSKFERTIEIDPAYDKRAQGFGIGTAHLIMNLKGRSGVVYFLMSTGWCLPHVAKEHIETVLNPKCGKPVTDILLEVMFLPSSRELGYHSAIPLENGQEPTMLTCQHLPGKTPCYCSSGCSAAEEPFSLLISQGHEAVWEFLERYYEQVFGKVEHDL